MVTLTWERACSWGIRSLARWRPNLEQAPTTSAPNSVSSPCGPHSAISATRWQSLLQTASGTALSAKSNLVVIATTSKIWVGVVMQRKVFEHNATQTAYI